MLTETLTGEREWDRPAGVPAELAALCARCRADDPRERPTAAEVHAALAGSAADEEAPAAPRGRGCRKRFSGGPARVLGPAAAVGLAAAAALTSVILPLSDAVGRRASPPLAPLPGPPSSPRTEPPSFAPPSFAMPPGRPTASPTPPPTLPPTRVVTPPRRPPSRRTLVIRLSRVREVIEAGRVHGELHPDVAAELDHLVTDFQTELAAGRPVAVGRRLDLLRTKIAERFQAGLVTRSRAQELLAAVDAVDEPVHAAPAYARVPS